MALKKYIGTFIGAIAVMIILVGSIFWQNEKFNEPQNQGQQAAVAAASTVTAYLTPGLKNLLNTFDPNVYTATAAGKSIFVSPNGLDTNAGTLAAPLASIQKAVDKAAPGDTVFLRGGIYNQVGYSSTARKQSYTLYISKGGIPGAPISIRNYSNEVPILDGSEALTLVPCVSVTTCTSLPSASNLFVASLPPEFDLGNTTIYENGTVLPITRSVPAERPFYFDNVKNGHLTSSSTEYTETTLADARVFNQTNSLYYSGAQIWINSCNNNLKLLDIKKFEPAANRITFNTIGCPGYLDKKNDEYVIANMPHTIRRGEMFIDRINKKAIIWPTDPINVQQKKIKLSKIYSGIILGSVNNISISGITFTQFGGDALAKWAGTSAGENIVIYKNTFINNGGSAIDLNVSKNARIAKNDISFQLGGGVHVVKAVNAVVSHNRVTNSVESGVRLYSSKDSWVNNNVVYNSGGHHANAFTLGYLENDGLFVERNFARNAGIALTLQRSFNLVYADNIFYSNSLVHPVSAWPGALSDGTNPRNIVFIGNTLVRENSPKKSVYIATNYQGVTMINNRLSENDSSIDKNPAIPNTLILPITKYGGTIPTAPTSTNPISTSTGTVHTPSTIKVQLLRNQYVYQEPSIKAKSTPLPILSQGVQSVQPVQKVGLTSWVYVFFDNGAKGYVPVRYVAKLSENIVIPVVDESNIIPQTPTPVPGAEALTLRIVATRNQSIYEASATSSRAIATIPVGTPGSVSPTDTIKTGVVNRAYVEFDNGMKGYIPIAYIKVLVN